MGGGRRGKEAGVRDREEVEAGRAVGKDGMARRKYLVVFGPRCGCSSLWLAGWMERKDAGT